MNKILLIVLLFAVVTAAAWAFNSGKDDGFTTVDVDEFERLIADTAKVQVVDVRTPQEYGEGHINNAILINVQDSTFLTQAEDLLIKGKTVAVYCRSGRRSANAARALVKAGYQVINLDGGILEWQKREKAVVK